jgi:diguanylate cyclase (GGDEF)-like protein
MTGDVAVVRGLSAGAYFRGCVDRSGRILSVDETATPGGRAGQSLLGLIARSDHPAVTGLLSDTVWDGIRVLRVSIPEHASPFVLVGLAARRLVDVALLLLHSKEELLLARDFQQLFESGEQAILAFDAEGTPMFSNARMARLLHCSPQDILLKPEAFLPADGSLRRADGVPVRARVRSVRIGSAAGERLGHLLVADDGEPPARELRLARTRLHDPLTGLPNRAYLGQHLTGISGGLAIVLANLRGFAMFNRQYGNIRGDQLLRAVSDRLRGLVGSPAVLVRLNKDEFVVALPAEGPEPAQALASRLRNAFAALVNVHEIEYQARLSCGIAFRSAGDGPLEMNELVAEAAREAH